MNVIKKKIITKHYFQKKLAIKFFNEQYFDYLRLLKTAILFKIGAQYEHSHFLARIIKPGNIIFDIGSNIGQYTCRFNLWVGEKGRVYSFEPVSENFYFLQSMVNFLRLKNVDTFQCGISDIEGKAVILIPKMKDTNIIIGTRASITYKIDEFENAELKKQKITLNSIDNLAELFKLKSLDLIKSDTEGYDDKVISGGIKTITTFRPYILLEINIDNKGLVPLMDLGYCPYYVDRGFLITADKRNSNYQNIFLAHQDKLNNIQKYIIS